MQRFESIDWFGPPWLISELWDDVYRTVSYDADSSVRAVAYTHTSEMLEQFNDIIHFDLPDIQ